MSSKSFNSIAKDKQLTKPLRTHWYNFALLFRETEDLADEKLASIQDDKERVKELMKILMNSGLPFSTFQEKLRSLDVFVPLADTFEKKYGQK